MTMEKLQQFAAERLVENGRALKAEITDRRSGQLQCILRPDNDFRKRLSSMVNRLIPLPTDDKSMLESFSYRANNLSGLPTWTPAEDEILRNSLRENLSARETAKLLPGKTRNAVIGRARRLRMNAKFVSFKFKRGRPKRELSPQKPLCPTRGLDPHVQPHSKICKESRFWFALTHNVLGRLRAKPPTGIRAAAANQPLLRALAPIARRIITNLFVLGWAS
jgi:hypothetical protein